MRLTWSVIVASGTFYKTGLSNAYIGNKLVIEKRQGEIEGEWMSLRWLLIYYNLKKNCLRVKKRFSISSSHRSKCLFLYLFIFFPSIYLSHSFFFILGCERFFFFISRLLSMSPSSGCPIAFSFLYIHRLSVESLMLHTLVKGCTQNYYYYYYYYCSFCCCCKLLLL